MVFLVVDYYCFGLVLVEHVLKAILLRHTILACVSAGWNHWPRSIPSQHWLTIMLCFHLLRDTKRNSRWSCFPLWCRGAFRFLQTVSHLRLARLVLGGWIIDNIGEIGLIRFVLMLVVVFQDALLQLPCAVESRGWINWNVEHRWILRIDVHRLHNLPVPHYLPLRFRRRGLHAMLLRTLLVHFLFRWCTQDELIELLHRTSKGLLHLLNLLLHPSLISEDDFII